MKNNNDEVHSISNSENKTDRYSKTKDIKQDEIHDIDITTIKNQLNVSFNVLTNYIESTYSKQWYFKQH